MKHYLLSIQQPDGRLPSPETFERIMQDMEVLNQELRASGAWVFAGRLHSPDVASVARRQNGQVLTTDGPYDQGKEHVGGLAVIKAADLDAATEWGRKLARATTLPVEVREFQGDLAEHLP